MAGSTNRSLQVKAAKARKARMERGFIEATKPIYLRERKGENRQRAAQVALYAQHI